MTAPRKNAEVVKAWADGAEVQYQMGDGTWVDSISPAFYVEGSVFRVKPAAPKWPQTTMTAMEKMALAAAYPCKLELIAKIANVALAHACESGQVVPAATVDKLMLQSHRREKDFLDQLFKLTFPLIPSDVNVLFSMTPPKYVKSFKQGEIIGRDMQIAINVRAACHAKLPGQVSNEELKTLIDLAK